MCICNMCILFGMVITVHTRVKTEISYKWVWFICAMAPAARLRHLQIYSQTSLLHDGFVTNICRILLN